MDHYNDRKIKFGRFYHKDGARGALLVEFIVWRLTDSEFTEVDFLQRYRSISFKNLLVSELPSTVIDIFDFNDDPEKARIDTSLDISYDNDDDDQVLTCDSLKLCELG